MLALALLTCSASRGFDVEARETASHTVVIEGMRFAPAAITVRPGDSVTWVNKDIVDHTATTPASASRPFDSQLIRQGKSWTRRFASAGTYEYLCTYHPTMTGSVTVSASRARRQSARE
jgi:plastocyanin